MASGKQDNDLLDFERSLRQLELLADTSTPTKRQSNTRNQEARSNTFNDVAFMPSPDAHQALATEQNMDLPDRKPSQSPRRDNQAGGNSTRRPSFSDLMTDSVLHGGGGVYEQMKRNMERTIERENERHQRRKTLRQIKDRDASEKARQAALQDRNRRNKSEATRERDKSPGKEHRSRADEPRRQPRREQQRRDPSKNLFTQSRSPSHREVRHHHQRQSSPRFHSPHGESDEAKSVSNRHARGNKNAQQDKQRSRTARTDASVDQQIPGPPSLEQIKEQHRMNALKVVDIYRQLQNSPLLAV